MLYGDEFYAHRKDVERTNPARHLYESLGFQPLPPPSRNGPTDLVWQSGWSN